jgi:hypothetical protein
VLDTDLAKLERLNRYRNDPWEFLKECVITRDETDKARPFKRFPCDLIYLYVYVRLWQRYPKIAVPKSRRMIMSWVNIALILWDAMFHEGRFNAIISKKEDAADELVRRAKFIYENIPESAIPIDLRPRMDYKFCTMVFPELNSRIQGFPQGADQTRQYTFSRIFLDEMAFLEEAQKLFSASIPTLEGGGQFVGVSSPGPGFFKQIVYDQVDVAETTNVIDARARFSMPGITQPADAPKRFMIQGVEVWINPKNKFLVFQLHYSANPNKRDASYRDSIRSSMPYGDYMQEYELQWDSFSGMPVFPDYDELIHGSKEPLQPAIGLPLLRGWDFGLTPAMIVAQLQGDQLVVLFEVVEFNMGAERFVPLALMQCRLKFPEWANQSDWLDFGDASGAFRKDTDEGSCFGVMVANGLVPRPSDIAFDSRRGSVNKYLLQRSKAGPGMRVDMGACPLFARGLKGGYRYPERAKEIEPLKLRPLKDEHSHVQDAFQAITTNLVKMQATQQRAMPEPSYRFGLMPVTDDEVKIG